MATHQPPSLSTLPTELIEDIASHLSIHELDIFRQCSRTICGACDGALTRVLRKLDGLPPKRCILPSNPDPYHCSGLDYIIDGPTLESQDIADVWLPQLKGEQVAKNAQLGLRKFARPSVKRVSNEKILLAPEPGGSKGVRDAVLGLGRGCSSVLWQCATLGTGLSMSLLRECARIAAGHGMLADGVWRVAGRGGELPDFEGCAAENET